MTQNRWFFCFFSHKYNLVALFHQVFISLTSWNCFRLYSWYCIDRFGLSLLTIGPAVVCRAWHPMSARISPGDQNQRRSAEATKKTLITGPMNMPENTSNDVPMSSQGKGVVLFSRAKLLLLQGPYFVQITIHGRLRIGRDGHLDQSEAYDV